MNRRCPQTLDKPILLFGLEIEDIAILSLGGGVASILFGPIIPGVITIIGWFVLMEFKKDKPSGYMIHWLYEQGVDFPGLITPIKKVERYSVYTKANFIKKFSLSR